VIFVCLVAFFSSCAKVGDPLPPLPKTVSVAEDTRLIQSGDELLFLFAVAEPSIEEVILYRQCSGAEPVEVLVEPVSGLPAYPGSDLKILRRPLPKQEKGCRFSIRLVDAKKGRSGYSPWLRTRSIPPPPPPRDLTARVEEDRIVLQWKPPEPVPANLLGYLVNCRHYTIRAEFSDRNFEFGTPVEYIVQSIVRRSSPQVLSEESEPLRVLPIDRFSPAKPENVKAVPVDRSVQLIWDAVTGSDLAGYRIYRGTRPGQLSVIEEFVEVNRFLDVDLPVGTMFYYEITALDKSGNESEHSKTISVNLNQ